MKREESIKTIKLMGMIGALSILSGLLFKILPIYGLNTLVVALPICWILCEKLDEKPRQGMLLAVVLIGALFGLVISARVSTVMILAALISEIFYGFSKNKKSDQRNKVGLITTFNTLNYPLLMLWELFATQGESTIMMTNFTVSILIFVFCHVLGFIGVRISLKDKVEYDY